MQIKQNSKNPEIELKKGCKYSEVSSLWQRGKKGKGSGSA
jgi:hypothetical protein